TGTQARTDVDRAGVGFDERLLQLLGEASTAVPTAPGRVRIVARSRRGRADSWRGLCRLTACGCAFATWLFDLTDAGHKASAGLRGIGSLSTPKNGATHGSQSYRQRHDHN